MLLIGRLDISKIKIFKEKIVTNEVVLTDERLLHHIMVKHKKAFESLKPYLKEMIENPDIILVDNKNENTIIIIKRINQLEKWGRIVIKIATKQGRKKHPKNSIITLMLLNKRTLLQTIKNRGTIIYVKTE